MVQSSNSLLAGVLALSLLVSRAHGLFEPKMVIGYAALTAKQAEDVKDDDKIKEEGVTASRILGPGLYLVNSPETFVPDQGSLFCVVEAEQEKIQKAPKVYIPQSYQRKTLRGAVETVNLWGDDRAIQHYLKHVAKIDDDSWKALRFPLVEKASDLQMVVTNKAVDKDQFKLKPKCFNSRDDLKNYKSVTVDWVNWGIFKASQ
ncbi:hypothetical protein LZ554_003918 [Drepanopeziza brunnea f. sp. 'monogermtubi']|nr:hypothetical protein LZ554_003918 [Drepanopeziza brunnea f. sp. 'monogermtubi']